MNQKNESSNEFAADFGFKKVGIGEKGSLVKKIFSQVAQKYDLMNDLMSFATHRLWKNKLIEMIEFQNQMQIVDMAAGTCDITIRLAKKAQNLQLKFQIEACDINEEMLEVGKARCIDSNLFSKINFSAQNGEKTSFADNQFDLYTIAFGIRNFSNLETALAEAYRILKPGAKFFCLEFCQVNDLFLQKAYDFYSFKIIPRIGELVLGDKDSYQYLVESIRKFPRQEEFKKLIETAGFTNVSYQNLSHGICAIHSAIKPY
jgi:demethylmenaquinone methyltransferase/2-methoxy-6-polyprenyl-1,4-benzoquinol methylase